MPFNGPSYELPVADSEEQLPFLHNSAAVYCTQCGTIYVSHGVERSCPACTLAEMIESVGDRVEQLSREQHQEGED